LLKAPKNFAIAEYSWIPPPEDYEYGAQYDFDKYKPYTFYTANCTSTYYANPDEPGLADALYPSTLDYFFEGINPAGIFRHSWGTTCVGERAKIFDADSWCAWTNDNYIVPWTCITLYVMMLYFLPKYMENRPPMKLRAAKTIWNFGLSLFSFIGFYNTAKHLLFDPYGGLVYAGLEKSICQHASNYGCGYSGIWVAAFIYSKCFELLDTFFILVAKRELIFLHWYHHITVLAFCWYAYSVRSSAGIYFAVVNYFIHSLMYFYYGMTQLSPTTRKMVKPYALHVTFLQTSQMLFGMVIVGLTVYYKYHRRTCYSYPHINLFAILMYSSYFVLFADVYVRKSKEMKARKVKSKKQA